MDDNKTCEHKWRAAGIWDGKTPEGQRTGGKSYKCDVCGEKVDVSSNEELLQKGGALVEGTNIYGKPLPENPNQ